MADELVFHVRRGLDVLVVGEALQERGFVLHFHIECVHQQDRMLLARIVAALEDGAGDEVRRVEAELRCRRARDFFRGVVEGELDFGEADHWGIVGGKVFTWQNILNETPLGPSIIGSSRNFVACPVSAADITCISQPQSCWK